MANESKDSAATADGLALDSGAGAGALAATPVGLHAIDDDVHGDPMEPGAEAAVSTERRQLLPRPDERVLRQLLGERAIAGHPHAEGVDAPDVRPIEPLERAPIAAGPERRIARLGPLLRNV